VTRFGITRAQCAENMDNAAMNEAICHRLKDAEGARFWRAQREVCEEMLKDWPEGSDGNANHPNQPAQ